MRPGQPVLFWAVSDRRVGLRAAPDLAWLDALTSFTFRLHEVGPSVYGGLIAWQGQRAHEILRAYRTITIAAPSTASAPRYVSMSGW